MVDRLYEKMDERQTQLMIGLDPNLSLFPEHILQEAVREHGRTYLAAASAIKEFNFAIIDATADLVPIFKPQSAYYEQYGIEGIRTLEETVAYAQEKGALVCLDAKRNDIGSTSRAYAEAHLGKVLLPDGTTMTSPDNVDFMTVNGYLGSDGINPFIEVADKEDKGIFILAKTSNPSSGELQDLRVDDHPIYIRMARLIRELGQNIGESGYSNVGAVVGATYPAEAKRLREILPHTLFLMPGYGAQGAKAEILVNGFDEEGRGAVVNSSRGITFAFSNEDFRKKYPNVAIPEKFAEAARLATIDSIIDINHSLKDANKLPSNWFI
ncbi:MAG: orotidine-5'-phosphate decarboxylase [archaeon]